MALSTPASAHPAGFAPLASPSHKQLVMLQPSRRAALSSAAPAFPRTERPDRLDLKCMMHQLSQVTLDGTDGGRQQPGVRVKTGCVLGLLPEGPFRGRGTPAQNRLSQNRKLSRRTRHRKHTDNHAQILGEKHTKSDAEENT